MDYILWITLIFALLLSLVALSYVLMPLLTKQPPLLPVDDDRLADLLARKDSALRAIKELEFDHQVGKIDAEDYQRFNQRLSRQAIGLIQQLEKITPESTALDEQVEQAIARRRQAQPVTAVPNAGTAQFCTECGTRLAAGYKFCANCGAPAPVAEAQKA